MNDSQLFEALVEVDTPTVCNALEIVMERRTASGFTTRRVVPMDPGLPPMVGYAVTAKLRASAPSEEGADEVLGRRLDYYRMVGESAARQPTIVVIEDTDNPAGVGAFWGEVNVAIHLGIGLKGVLTNGSMRDLGDVDEGFQVLAGTIGPSHAHVHITDLAVPVTVLGLEIAPGDLIHGDRHGAVVMVHYGRIADDAEAPRPDLSDTRDLRIGTLDMQARLSSNMITFCMTDFLDDYPNAIVMSHNLGGNMPFEVDRLDHRTLVDDPDRPLPSAAIRAARVMVDCNSLGASAIERAVDVYGAHRIVLGTDGTDFGMKWSIEAIAGSRLSDADKQAILHGNAAAVLEPLIGANRQAAE